jgi:DNA repair exonuclease SbcCD ATPase subunit
MKPMFAPLLPVVWLALSAVPGWAADQTGASAAATEQEQRNGTLEQKIDEIDRQLDLLEKSLKGARKEAQGELKKKLPELRLREQQLQKDLGRLRESGQKAWQELEAVLADMQRAIERSRERE